MPDTDYRPTGPIILIQDFDGERIRAYELECPSAQEKVRDLLEKMFAAAHEKTVARHDPE